ncbi:hypothetical protein [Acinetobacter gerneri]|uniref:hypothetical protein n=1 Tax=Acinetobacter gerneri TaxID=202952 RepID=UPI003214BB19
MKKITYLISASLLMHLTSANASTQTGKVSQIYSRDYDGLVWIYIQGERTGEIPACAKGGYMMIKNENSPTGKRQLALLMMAQAANKTVSIEGTNTCTRWVDGEDIGTVSIRK